MYISDKIIEFLIATGFIVIGLGLLFGVFYVLCAIVKYVFFWGVRYG